MMRSKILLTALLAGSVALTFSVPATSAPLMAQSNMSKAGPSSIETVQYYRRGYYRYGPGYYGYRGGAGAVIGGLAAGAIIGGAIAAGQANAAAAAQQNMAYCAQRFRSYDPGSGTYLGTDGYRHPCP
ncbi:hypothetical protein NB311A_03454 [Nitrobacter sp. Nb-311A]|uniref:BA14K family protein n=1 Tax=unclassified Nitrobacter TaxID=2620411 RepID=UPI000068635F|nr:MULTISPECIES: BA14K family protein [unclassified Nitrobacter]EAQ37332.1 hypothetical protein NB311A_03454 [Nitrobacter sp. Nb-311A]MCB1391740.1 BA14K family protein [Nitrobacter sp.]MCV0384847.1 BA14K family protein [Nitrobacter sp.]